MNETKSDLAELSLHLQVESQQQAIPTSDQFERWVKAALFKYKGDAELTIRIVDEEEGAALNEQYRKKSGPTNVLSFPFEAPETPDGIGEDWLGDLVICAPVVSREAEEQSKQLLSHWAHLVIHGVLHLLGFDHLDETEALEMELYEIEILQGLGIKNPYEETVV